MPSEWLLRFRALKSARGFSETCADSLYSPDSSSSSDGCAALDRATNRRPIGAIEAIGTQHSNDASRKAPIRQDGFEANGVVERQEAATSWDAEDWRAFFDERAAFREFEGGYDRVTAERLAWGEMQNKWHMLNGERVSQDLCAGCRRPIGTEP